MRFFLGGRGGGGRAFKWRAVGTFLLLGGGKALTATSGIFICVLFAEETTI